MKSSFSAVDFPYHLFEGDGVLKKYTLWLDASPNGGKDYFPSAVADYSDRKSYQSVCGHYTNSKNFDSVQQAERWINRNLRNFDFKVNAYAVVLNGDFESSGGNDYEYPFNWVSV